MAERRMFAKTIVLSDDFLDMPMSARCLYFTLGMLADDDGFVNNPRSIMRQCGASNDDMLILINKHFVIAFDNGVIVIKHWRINNYLRNDRYHETKYLEEKSQLSVNDNGSWHFGEQIGIPDGIPSIDKNSIDKNSIDNIGDSEDDTEVKKADIDKFFNEIWNKYPKKKGKGQISDAKKKTLYGIGIDEITRCIERYKQYIYGKDDQYIMYGSTFFNSGYVDYLDENYESGSGKYNTEDDYLPFQ